MSRFATLADDEFIARFGCDLRDFRFWAVVVDDENIDVSRHFPKRLEVVFKGDWAVVAGYDQKDFVHERHCFRFGAH